MITIFITLLFSQLTFAANFRALENQLLVDEWGGSKKFIEVAREQKIDECSYLLDKMKKHNEITYVKRRLIKVLTLTSCQQKMQVAEKFLQDKDVLIQVASIELAASLEPSERAKLTLAIKGIAQLNKDQAIQAAAKSFLEK